MDNMQQQFFEAGTLMLAGMVFVFVFLSILIVFINTVLAKLAVKFPDAIVVTPPRSTKKNKNKSDDSISPSVVAAISGAVQKFRSEHGNKQ